ncbi:MAG: hypothetical protein ACRC8S_20330 [Fimbriiglobus sp.]
MDGMIGYLNTDLDLVFDNDLAGLVAAFEVAGVSPLYVTQDEKNGSWLACFETAEQYAEPEPNIAAMLAVVESLAPSLQTIWAACSRREFNIGWVCGLSPQGFQQRLSPELLTRIAAVGSSLGWTLYPEHK